MGKIKSQVIHNLKKDKGAYISFGLIILFTAFMLNLALVLTFQVDKAYDAKFDALNTASVNVCIPEAQNSPALMRQLNAINGVSEVEAREAVFAEAVVKDFRGTDFSMNTVFYNLDDERSTNRLHVRQDQGAAGEQSIWLPLYVANFGEFPLGSEIVYEVNGSAYTFWVTGVVEEMQYGNYGKGMMGAYLPGEAYEAFARDQKSNAVIEYSLTAEDASFVEDIKNGVSSVLDENGVTMLTICDRVSTKDARTMVCDLLILILLAFAFVILLVSVFLCKFRISNSIEDEMVNMGVLKAMGYTGNMIVASLVMPYGIVTVLTASLGVLLSYGVLPVLSGVLTMQSGFSFALAFDAKGLACTLILLVLIVLAFTSSAAKRIKKVQPINAIRGNAETRHIRKNYFPLEKASGSTQLRLVFKQMLACKKQNVLLFLVSFVLTVLMAFSGTLFYNVIIKPENFMSTLSEETPDVILLPEKDRQEQLIDVLQVDLDVNNILQYTLGNGTIGDTAVTAFVCEDFSRVSNDLCYSGRNPQAENEIALGSAFEGTYRTGDTVTIENGAYSRTYNITGFIQSVNYQGNVCALTMAGYKALTGGSVQPSLYVYLREGAAAADFIETFENDHPGLAAKIINSQKMAQTSQEMYSGISTVIIAAIFILTMLIVLFILYIVIKSLLVRRKQELGIYKAMGYTNRQLMLQTAGSFLPVTIAAVLLSSALGMLYMPWINQAVFQTIGAVKNNMEVSFGFLMIFAALQIAMNFVISICLTLPIRKISAYALIKE